MLHWVNNILINVFNYHPVKTIEVFTPTKAADLNYIERPELEKQINSSLDVPGKQIVIFGHSGSGKTTVVRRLLNRKGLKFIQIHCEKNTTYNDILLDSFDQLDMFITSEKSIQTAQKISGKLSAEYKSIKSELVTETSKQDSQKQVRLLPSRLTPQKLATFCGEGEIVLIIEDFHKVEESEKKRIADLLKIFVDKANDYTISQIICIGACENVTDLVKLEPNLQCRVDECKVAMLSDKNIAKIVSNGCKLLNVTMEDSLQEKIVYYSARIGSQAHQMCYDIFTAKGIDKRQRKTVHLTDVDFEYAVRGFLRANEGTLSTVYEAAIRNQLGWYILKTFSRNQKSKLPFKEICKIVNSSKMTFTEDDIQAKLNELCSSEFGVLYFNTNSGKYSLASPFWQSFLRMQFAHEDAERRQAEQDKHNEHLKINYIDKSSKEAAVDRLLLEYLKNLYEQHK